ncbi:3-dehydroquinate dehydratase, type I [Syntrophotalea carbinolica DSM 2380]|uniref:3-dehydroquinate dehydratase n=1 Tax=Syntrophotalea carbinolica (strain DSM 2380 / NBRC 103641 / GraBd1) TaxID=338963 RepID=AROD_SYNC1|nr:type I 3-dehydroquinate dehydratase [Syntrophotalea carbinolica]Q3A2I0.1 RecName: Full=3-dehydroquinate dehydratase; Short=3-dehydroquinase; AltName: Full=Type I DHQase; AltName: Full=Type I dehydroquinase; Short=DHQ1 [Syntrophotalea carbinolica DSM 2380]ABA89427.1 3-dehydroquinate dehydratase, type I [Syntrophotalea carbinolica DSM 2380]
MATVKVRDVVFGAGAPKICVPMVGRTLDQLVNETEVLKVLDFDLAEWRVDFFEHVEDIEEVKSALFEIRARLGEKPLLFTFRSKREGGQREVSDDYYGALNKALAQTGEIDLVDVELFQEQSVVRELVDTAHEHGVKVVMSSHDFARTPVKEEILMRLCRMQELGADLPKIAVMPQNASDVLVLLDATNTMREHFADRPFITMSMSGLGGVTRLAGEVFGSALTFGSAVEASAPGQINAADLRNILNLLHMQT